MLIWCSLLFFLGVAAFLDSFYNYGEIFRTLNSILFMATSLGLLVRIMRKSNARYIEGLLERIEKLQSRVSELETSKYMVKEGKQDEREAETFQTASR